MNSKISLDKQITYQIKIPGKLDSSWLDHFGVQEISVEVLADNTWVSTLTGAFDQAKLHKLLRSLYSYGLPLISIVWINN